MDNHVLPRRLVTIIANIQIYLVMVGMVTDLSVLMPPCVSEIMAFTQNPGVFDRWAWEKGFVSAKCINSNVSVQSLLWMVYLVLDLNKLLGLKYRELNISHVPNLVIVMFDFITWRILNSQTGDQTLSAIRLRTWGNVHLLLAIAHLTATICDYDFVLAILWCFCRMPILRCIDLCKNYRRQPGSQGLEPASKGTERAAVEDDEKQPLLGMGVEGGKGRIMNDAHAG